MANSKTSTDLTQGSVVGTLMKFAVPLALTSVLQVVYGIVDTIIAGRVLGSSALSAVTNASFLMLVVGYFAQGVAQGGNILISQYFGAKDDENRKLTSSTLYTFEMGLSIIFLVIVLLLRHQLVNLLRVPAHDEAVQYVTICSVGLIFTFGYNAVSAVLRAMGNSKQPLIFIGIATVINIVLDLWFVLEKPYGLGLGVAGTAYATVIAQFVTFAASIIYTSRHRDYYGMRFLRFRIDIEKLGRIIKLGIPSTLQYVVNGISWMVISAFINKYGLTVSAAAGAVNKTRELLLQLVIAISNGAAIMIGQSIGANNYDRCKKIVRSTTLISVSTALLLIVIVEFAAPYLIQVFNKEPDVIAQGTLHLRIEVLCLLFYASNMSYKSAASGAGKVLFCFIDSFVAAVITRSVLAVVLDKMIGVTGVYWACVFAMLPATIVAFWYYKSGRWTRGKAID